MKIPLEHFATTPVFTLRPQQQTTSEVDGGISSKPSKWKKNSSTFGVFGVKTVGSAPTSPVVSRKFTPVPAESGPNSCFESIAFQVFIAKYSMYEFILEKLVTIFSNLSWWPRR